MHLQVEASSDQGSTILGPVDLSSGIPQVESSSDQEQY